MCTQDKHQPQLAQPAQIVIFSVLREQELRAAGVEVGKRRPKTKRERDAIIAKEMAKTMAADRAARSAEGRRQREVAHERRANRMTDVSGTSVNL